MALERMDVDHYRWYERGVVKEHLARYAFAKDYVARMRVLDVACGTGYGTRMLAENAACVTGVDLSPDAVAAAIARPGATADFCVGDASALAFDDAAFDRVCSFETIEHLPQPLIPKALSEFARVLRPDGRLIISTPDRRSYSLDGPTGNRFHEVEFSLGEFSDLLRPHFEIESVHGQKFSRPASLGLAKALARTGGHAGISKAWRAYKMVLCGDETVRRLDERPTQIPMVIVFVARKKPTQPA